MRKRPDPPPAHLRIQAENMAVEGYLTLILVFRPPHRFPYNVEIPLPPFPSDCLAYSDQSGRQEVFLAAAADEGYL